MKKHYLILGVTLLVGLQVVLSHADIVKQSLKQISFPQIIEEQVTRGQIAESQIDQEESGKPVGATDLTALVPQKCWSARKCKGKVLNNMNAHDCKNSGGKSWNDNQGVCYKL